MKSSEMESSFFLKNGFRFNDLMYDELLSMISRFSRSKSLLSLRKALPAYGVLLIGVAVSVCAWYVVRQKVEATKEASFQASTQQAVHQIQSSFNEHSQVLSSMRTLYDGTLVQVVRDVFELYGSVPVRTNASIMSVSYAPTINESFRPEFEYYARSEGIYEFAIKPQGIRESYSPIEYVVPYEVNKNRCGYDISTHPILRDAMEKAKKNGTMSCTPIFNIRDDGTKGFVLMVPANKEVSGNAFVVNSSSRNEILSGVVLLEINADKFFKGALAKRHQNEEPAIVEFIKTGSTNDAIIQLVDGKFRGSKNDQKRIIPLFFADRKIEIYFGNVAQVSLLGEIAPLASGLSLLVLSFLLFGLVLSTMTSRDRAQELAKSMTRSQRRILDTSKDIIATFDLQFNWVSVNPAIVELLGVAQERLIGGPLDGLIVFTSHVQDMRNFIAKAHNEESRQFEVLMHAEDGSQKWICWSLIFSLEDSAVFGIGRDITASKQAKELIELKNKQVRLAEQYARESNDFKAMFMTKLSFYLCFYITGTMSYLQILSKRLNDLTDQDTDFLAMAQRSSEHLFTVVTDLLDIASTSRNTETVQSEHVQAAFCVREAIAQTKAIVDDRGVIIRAEDISNDVQILAQRKPLTAVLSGVMSALTEFKKEAEIDLTVQGNHYEKIVEIQMLVNGDQKVTNMLETMKLHRKNLIEVLTLDENDVLFRLSIAQSEVRRMGGSITIEPLGKEEIAVQITLPLWQSDVKNWETGSNSLRQMATSVN